MNKNLTYRQRIVRTASIGVVAFTLMWIAVGFARFGGIYDYNTQQLVTFFILACSVTWIWALLSATVTIVENWLLKKLEQMDKNAE